MELPGEELTVLYTAEPGSPPQDALNLLASGAATWDQQALRGNGSSRHGPVMTLYQHQHQHPAELQPSHPQQTRRHGAPSP